MLFKRLGIFMMNTQISFNGKITLRRFDDLKNKMVIDNIRTKKDDDIKLVQLTSSLVNPKEFDWKRKVLTPEQTKTLDDLLEKILKIKIPDTSFSRSMYTTDNQFFYMLTHPDALISTKPSPLQKGGIAIDFSC